MVFPSNFFFVSIILTLVEYCGIIILSQKLKEVDIMGDTIVIDIPFSIINKDDGSKVNVIDVLNILKDVFASSVHVDSKMFNQFCEELESTKGHTNGMFFNCKVQLNTLASLAQVANDAPTAITPHTVVEWVRNKIVSYLLDNMLVTDDLATLSSRQVQEIALKEKLSLVPEN